MRWCLAIDRLETLQILLVAMLRIALTNHRSVQHGKSCEQCGGSVPPIVMSQRAVASRKQGQVTIEKAVEIAPHRSDFHSYLEKLNVAHGNTKQAAEHHQRAIDLRKVSGYQSK